MEKMEMAKEIETEKVTEIEEFDQSALEAKVDAELEKVFGDETEDEGRESVDDAVVDVDETQETAETETEEETEEEVIDNVVVDTDEGVAKTEEQTEEQTEEAATDESGVPTLPDSYRRSLKARGWDDESIDQNLEVMGSQFITAAAKMHEDRNWDNNRYAEAGRRAAEQNRQPVDTPVSVNTQPQGHVFPQPIDIAALKERVGDDEIIDSFAVPFNAMLQSMAAVIPDLQAGQRIAQQAANDKMVQDVDAFFGGSELEPYVKIYGTDSGSLDGVQIENRNRVIGLAGNLIAGKREMENKEMGLNEALQTAHDMVSADYKETAAREKVKGTVRKRAKGVTNKPGNRATKVVDETKPPDSEEELIARTNRRLAAMSW